MVSKNLNNVKVLKQGIFKFFEVFSSIGQYVLVTAIPNFEKQELISELLRLKLLQSLIVK